jgi:hypothetical protein
MHGRIWVALILIGIGAILVLQQIGVTVPSAWWALLLLIPAAAGLFAAWRSYGREGRVTTASAGPFAGAVALVIVMLAFLAGIAINWNLIGPIALVLLGIGMLMRRPRPG